MRSKLLLAIALVLFFGASTRTQNKEHPEGTTVGNAPPEYGRTVPVKAYFVVCHDLAAAQDIFSSVALSPVRTLFAEKFSRRLRAHVTACWSGIPGKQGVPSPMWFFVERVLEIRPNCAGGRSSVVLARVLALKRGKESIVPMLPTLRRSTKGERERRRWVVHRVGYAIFSDRALGALRPTSRVMRGVRDRRNERERLCPQNYEL